GPGFARPPVALAGDRHRATAGLVPGFGPLPKIRPGSPPFGFSTLTTSAPSEASTSVQEGPASNCERSRTRTPWRQFGATPTLSIARHFFVANSSHDRVAGI